MRRQLDISVLLAVAVAAVVLRIPGSVVLLMLSGPVVILVRGLRRHSGLRASWLWLFLVTGITCSALALAPTPAALAGVNSAVILTAQLLVAVAALRTGAPRMALRWLTGGLYAGLVGLYLVGAYEVVSGHKMLPLLYPDASGVELVENNRLLATAVFPNYNDFSVALTTLCCLCLSRLVFGRGARRLRLLVDAVLLVTSTLWIVAMGSRGSLLALALMAVLTLLAGVMAVHRGLVRPPHVLASVLALAVAASVVWTTPLLQDTSTQLRVKILGQATSMMLDDPYRLLFGWGSYPRYKEAAGLDYGTQLMDTHNILLELVVTHGLPTLLAFVACWLVVVVRGLLQQRLPVDWRSMSMVVMVAALPVLGVVPSSLMRYHWPFLVLTAACTALALGRQEHTGATVVDAQHTGATRPVTPGGVR